MAKQFFVLNIWLLCLELLGKQSMSHHFEVNNFKTKKKKFFLLIFSSTKLQVVLINWRAKKIN